MPNTKQLEHIENLNTAGQMIRVASRLLHDCRWNIKDIVLLTDISDLIKIETDKLLLEYKKSMDDSFFTTACKIVKPD